MNKNSTEKCLVRDPEANEKIWNRDILRKPDMTKDYVSKKKDLAMGHILGLYDLVIICFL